MKQSHSLLGYFQDIVNAIQKISHFTQGIEFQDFQSNEEKVYAVLYGLSIIGEAVKHVPDSIKEQYPEIFWRLIAGMRDKLIHDYFEVHLPKVWQTIKRDLPVLQASVSKIMTDLGNKI